MPAQALDLVELYETHAQRVWRTVARLGVRPPNIEDAVQEVFLAAHRQLGEFEGRSSAVTWLIGIAVKTAANHRRRQARGVVPLVDALPAPGPGVEEELERRRRAFELEEVLQRLPPEQREVVVLCDLEQLSGPEVSEALEVNLNTIYSRLRLGRAALLKALTAGQESAS
jgi:RNA polymerase sigma-70 factor (ECF subfamily)